MACCQQQSRALVECIEAIEQVVNHIDDSKISSVNPEVLLRNLRAASANARLSLSSEGQVLVTKANNVGK